MPGFTDGIVPFVNGVVEIKTSEGSLSKAVSLFRMLAVYHIV